MESKWPKELILIRHGRSARNDMKDAARQAGKSPHWGDGVRDQDSPLTLEGERQAIETGKALSALHYIDVMFVSPYLRTRQTADLILAELDHKVKVVSEERIREIEFGMLDGFTAEGLQERYPEEVARRKKEGKYWYRPPGGESRPDVKLRGHSWLGTLTRDYRGQVVVAVEHSVVVLAHRALLERWDEEQYLQIDMEDDVKNCSVTTYQCSEYGRHGYGRLELASYNKVYYE